METPSSQVSPEPPDSPVKDDRKETEVSAEAPENEAALELGLKVTQGDEGMFSNVLSSVGVDIPKKLPPDRAAEKVFYNSARSQRTICGKYHYCVSCPGWNKATTMRVVYSRWEWGTCCCVRVPTGRQLDTFDADIIVDMSAHQSCCQICRGEGDIVMWRLAGGDLSASNDETFTMTDVSSVFDVFSNMTFELAKMNLKDAAALGLGRRMGAVVHQHDAPLRHGRARHTTEVAGEYVYYDSSTSKRTLVGQIMNSDCFLPPVYKITSERVLHVEWDVWYPCDDPLTSCCYLPYYVGRGAARDMCCGGGVCSAGREDPQARAAQAREDRRRNAERSCLGRRCRCPTGRTAHFFDLDVVVDVGAHQRCAQLALNEGDLLLHRLGGGDTSDPQQVFTVTNVPEVFNTFDDLSYDLSKMNLKNFRQSTVAQRMVR